MLVKWIPVRLHGWLDEVATMSYLVAAFVTPVHGLAFGLLLAGAAVHFLNTRLTDYPQGQLKLYSLATHAKIELAEGLVMLVAAFAFVGASLDQQLTFAILGGSQLGAALLGDTRLPQAA
jgi:hypothetical protein